MCPFLVKRKAGKKNAKKCIFFGAYDKVINAKNAAEKKYNIVTLPITAKEVEWLGWRANYLNYAGNDVVLSPPGPRPKRTRRS